MARNPKLVWAAGGESLCAPEDTLPAYWGAIGAGADAIALGVQLTVDGMAICCRNASLETTANDQRKIDEVTARELRGLDAGAKFRSTVLDEENQSKGNGDDYPWIGHKGKADALYHPELGEALLSLSRNISWQIMKPSRNRAPGRASALYRSTKWMITPPPHSNRRN